MAGRPLDEALEAELNRTLPADGDVYRSVVDACRAGIAARLDVQPRACGHQVWARRQAGAGDARVFGRRGRDGQHRRGSPSPSERRDRLDHADRRRRPRFDGRGAGWLVYEPGTAHVPTVTGGKALRALSAAARRDRVHQGLVSADEPSCRDASCGRRCRSRAGRSSQRPPRSTIPRDYNAAHDLIERNLARGARRQDRLHRRSRRVHVRRARGAREPLRQCARRPRPARRSSACCSACSTRSTFPPSFLGAIKAGIVPIAGNTLLTTADYDYMLRDSRARALVVSAPLLPAFAPLLGKLPHLAHVIVSGRGRATRRIVRSRALMAAARADVRGRRDDVRRRLLLALFVGIDRRAEGHRARAFEPRSQTAELYAKPILGIREDDVVFSAAKLFFAYGLGNALTFPLAVGATTVLMAERPTPAAVFARLRKHRPTIFYGVPTLFAALLASPELPQRGRADAARAARRRARRCRRRSAGAGPSTSASRSSTASGSTEMLHIFLSNRPGDVRYGTSGMPVPGYELRIVGDDGEPVAAGRGRRAADQRADRRDRLLEQSREDARHVPGAVDAQRRQVLDRRGRLLRLLRPQRRHAQGGRHLRVADRGRGGADHASGGARGRGDRPRGRRASS